MKLTTEELRKIIKEELGEVVRESYADRRGFERRPVHDEMANVISKIKKARRELVAQIAKENPRMGEMEKNELILNIAGPNTVQQDIIDAFKQMRKRYSDEDDKYEIDKQLAARGVNVDELEEVKHLSTIISEELEAVLDEKKGSKRQRKKKAKKKKASDRCTRIAKRKYDVWPSAYASGAVVKCRKGKIWKGLKEGELSDLEKAALEKFEEEGGAAGEDMMIKFLKEKGATEEEAKKILDKVSDVHQDGDLVTPMNEEELEEKKKACKPSKGKRFAKRVNGKCRSYGQKGKAKDGGDRIRPGTKKGDAYCARSAKIKKCKNPPCANDLSRKKWKCRGSKSMKEQEND